MRRLPARGLSLVHVTPCLAWVSGQSRRGRSGPRACIFTGDRLPGPHARTERGFLHVITQSQRSRLYMAGIPHEEGRPLKKVPCLPWVSGQSRRRLCGYPAMIRPRGCPKMPTWPGYKGNAPARGRGPRGVNGRRAAIINSLPFLHFSPARFFNSSAAAYIWCEGKAVQRTAARFDSGARHQKGNDHEKGTGTTDHGR